MNKYLLAILQESNTIIIPRLGALTITNKQKGEVMFMPYLKHDDGKLASYIREKDGIDETTAKNKITKYVREIETTIAKGDTFDIFEFGTFFKNNRGEVEFKTWKKKERSTDEVEQTSLMETSEEVLNDSENNEASEDEKQSEDPKASKKIIPPVIPVVYKAVDKVTNRDKNKEASEDVKQSEDPKASKKNIPPVIPVINKAVDKVTNRDGHQEAKSSNGLKETVITSVSQTQLAIERKDHKDEKKRRRGFGFWMLIALLALILFGSIYAVSNFDRVRQHIPFLADGKKGDGKERNSQIDKMNKMIGNGDGESSDGGRFSDDGTQDSGVHGSADGSGVEGSENGSASSSSHQGNSNGWNNDRASSAAGSKSRENNSSSTSGSATGMNGRSGRNNGSSSGETSGGNGSGEARYSGTSTGYEQGNYHVIAGAFQVRSNATRMVRKLNAQGFQSSTFLNNGFNVVSIQRFASSSEAKSELFRLRQTAPNAWILHKK